MMHHETHQRAFGDYIKDIIYGANDGIITTFAVVAGVVGASLEPKIIVILGIANLLADGFSMAASDYLGSKSERALIETQQLKEKSEVKEQPEYEAREVRDILVQRGYAESDAASITALIQKNDDFFVDFMMKYELKLTNQNESDIRAAIWTFFAFVIAGSLPILPFVFMPETTQNLLLISAFSTAAALFAVGALRYFVTKRHWLISGLEMLLIGGTAALIAYGIGFVISNLL